MSGSSLGTPPGGPRSVKRARQPPGGCGTLRGLGRLGFFPMLRRCSYVIGLAVMLVGLPTAQAADTTLTLACQGTATSGVEDAKPEPVSMGIIVNFTKRTVQGFGHPGLIDYPVQIPSAFRAR